MGPGALAQVLQPLMLQSHPNLLVGLHTSDDAAVYRLSDDMAIVQTTDFFPPIVDDPFTFGGIAAANSLSDIYAMGGEVLFALNIVAFPDSLPTDILGQILAGGAAKVTEAGGVVAGGHTVTDDEPKYGLSVTGRVHPDRVWRKGGAQTGNLLYLTKPIGTGIVSTALKRGAADPADVEAAVASMLLLNRGAAELGKRVRVNACTDITGFGLLGHAQEMAIRSDRQLQIDASAVPLLPGTLRYAENGHIAGGLVRNREHYSGIGVSVRRELPEPLTNALFDPQTSGGLLIAIPAIDADTFEVAARAAGQPQWRIGIIADGSGVVVS